jgi:hypothetical protein
LATVNSLWDCDITPRMQHSVHDEEPFMEEALAAIRQAISNDKAGETTLAPAMDLPRTSGRETNTRGWIAVPRSNYRSRLCVQHVDGNCEETRADTRGCGSRNASPDAEVMAGRKLAPRGRANGAGRSRTDHSRTLTTIPAEQANKASKAGAERPPATLAGVEEGE